MPLNFYAIQLFGADGNLLHPRIISLSYPWIGIPMEIFRDNGVSSVPFLAAHFTRLVVYYFMFQATQLLMSMLFFDDDVPGIIDMWFVCYCLLAPTILNIYSSTLLFNYSGCLLSL